MEWNQLCGGLQLQGQLFGCWDVGGGFLLVCKPGDLKGANAFANQVCPGPGPLVPLTKNQRPFWVVVLDTSWIAVLSWKYSWNAVSTMRMYACVLLQIHPATHGQLCCPAAELAVNHRLENSGGEPTNQG